MLRKLGDSSVDDYEKGKIKRLLAEEKAEKMKERIEVKKDLTEEFTFNFYDRLINQEQKNRKHD
jgi:hypothetical protein